MSIGKVQLVRVPDEGVPSAGEIKVLPDSVSVPVKVANVPVVGRVTFVAAVEVKVVEYAPAVIKEPPFTIVRVADVAG